MNHVLTIYFDGLCHLCSREIEHYKRHPRAGKIRWVDIAAPDFDEKKEGLRLKDLVKSMHSRKTNGEVIQGIDSFAAIWETLGGYSFLRYLIQAPLTRPIFKLGYAGFARLRPYLPKRKQNYCSNSRCS